MWGDSLTSYSYEIRMHTHAVKGSNETVSLMLFDTILNR